LVALVVTGRLPWGVFGENFTTVLVEGEVTAGDSMDLFAQDENGITVADVISLYRTDATNQELLRRVTEVPSRPKAWRDYFRKRLWNPDD
jgi:MOSC domain-containing protein YiiM